MGRIPHPGVMVSLAFLVLVSFRAESADAAEARSVKLEKLLTPTERAFLLSELSRVEPPERLRDLASYGQRQLELGGGFYGMLPDQLTDRDSIPIPKDAAGRLDAALHLARQRSTSLAALEGFNADYALAFRGESLPAFLGQLERPPIATAGAGLSLELDTSALTGFFAALEDGEVTAEEAAELAALPSNQAMLQHRRSLGYVPEPLPDTESLAEMIRMAGSSDPLDRLWCWINVQNAFGYADLAGKADGYRQVLSELESHGGPLVKEALRRIERYAPRGTRFKTHFALTAGWAIRGWATPQMAGINLEQIKDNWSFLFGTLIEETYHRLQIELFPCPTGGPAREFDDLVAIETGDPRYDRLYEIVTYTVAEGAANLARGEFAAPDLVEKAPAGAELLTRFVREVVEGNDPAKAEALINDGLQGNGPLYGLGWKLASLIAERDGARAVGELQREGPVRFCLRGASVAAEMGQPLLAPAVVTALETLEEHTSR